MRRRARTGYGPATLRRVGERLEVFAADGRPTGVAKDRAAIHRDGDWHLAFFCWVVRAASAGPEIVLQRRAATKDVWPGRWDASAAGHVRFGETELEAAREIEEELGVRLALDALVPIGRHLEEHVHPGGLVDREIHATFVARCDHELDAYRPDPAEVDGLCAIEVGALLGLAEGTIDRAEVDLAATDRGALGHRRAHLAASDLVPYAPAYLRRVAEAARALADQSSGRASIARR